MRLVEAHVTKFKSVWDSTPIAIEPDVTALVGKNESGKTAILQAIYRLRPLTSGHATQFEELRDYPRRWRSRDADSIVAAHPVMLTFEFDEEDVRSIEQEFGPGVIEAAPVALTKLYGAEAPTWNCRPSISLGAALRHAVATAGLDADRYVGVTLDETITKLRADTDAEAAIALADSLAKSDIASDVCNAVYRRVPSFLYFDEYQVLPGRVSIRRLQTVDEKDLNPDERTALSLLRLARVDTAEFGEADYEQRKAALEAAANQLTRSVAQ